MNWLIRQAVVSARLTLPDAKEIERAFSNEKDFEEFAARLEQDIDGWHLSPGVQSIGRMVAGCATFDHVVLTSNFDPLIEMAIRRARGRCFSTVAHGDPALIATRAEGCNVVHFNGYWTQSDTLHTQSQLTVDRPKLRSSIARLLRDSVVVVMAYSGWDDVFTKTLLDTAEDDAAFPEVLWTLRAPGLPPDASDARGALGLLKAGVGRGRVSIYSGIDVHVFLPILESTLSVPASTAGEPTSYEDDAVKPLSLPNGAQAPDILEATPTTKEGALLLLERVPRWTLPNEPQFAAVRRPMLEQARRSLLSEKLIWIGSEWGLGKEGFLAATLRGTAGFEDSLVFRVDLDEEQLPGPRLLNEVESQLGIPIQQLCAAAEAGVSVVLVFDNAAVAGDNDASAESIRALHEFAEYLNIVVFSRRTPGKAGIQALDLEPLDEPDCRRYIESHPDGGRGVFLHHVLDVLYDLSEGVPMYLDRLLKLLRTVSALELREFEAEYSAADVPGTDFPHALEKAIRLLSANPGRYSQRSFKLLKRLTVLARGESLRVMRRFDAREPVYPRNVEELLELGLVYPVPVVRAVSLPGKEDEVDHEVEKLLRVPKQVREYVRTLIDDAEMNEILSNAGDLFFGERWREGIWKPRFVESSVLAAGATTGPSNARVVLALLLRSHVRHADEHGTRVCLRLAEAFVEKLLSDGRFREGWSLAEETHAICLHGDVPISERGLITHLYGRALRMLNDSRTAAKLQDGLLEDWSDMPKATRPRVLMELAYAREQLGQGDAAIEAAQIVEKEAVAGSWSLFSAKQVLIERRDPPDKQVGKLKALEQSARKQNITVAANNAAIAVARRSRSDAERWYDKVLGSSGDDYNRVRAIVGKAEILVQSGRIDSLRHSERKVLHQAYGYLWLQRLESLYQSCHAVLWKAFAAEGRFDVMVRLFRQASFFWRVTGEGAKEVELLNELLALQSIGALRAAGVSERDMAYLENRLHSCNAETAH